MPQTPQAYQSNFTAGELSPLVDARVDLAKYYNGCSLLENMLVIPQGGAAKRGGTRFVAEIKDSNTQVRTVRFEYSSEQAYLLEFGHLYVRFFKDDGQIMAATSYIDYYPETNYSSYYTMTTVNQKVSQSFTGSGVPLTKVQLYLQKIGSPTGTAVVKLYAHAGVFGTSSLPTGAALATSDNLDVSSLPTAVALIEIAFSTPYTPVAGTKYCIAIEYAGGTSVNYIRVWSDGTAPTHPGNAGYYSAGAWTASAGVDLIFYAMGTSATPYEVVTPWTDIEVASLNFSQSADVLYIAHGNYETRKLLRLGHANWRLEKAYVDQQPLSEDFWKPAGTLTPGAVSGTGVTFTASGAATFLAGDVNRFLNFGVCRAKIKTYISATQVTADILIDFPNTSAIPTGSWSMNGSGSGVMKYDPDDGTNIWFAEGAERDYYSDINTFRAEDVGKYFRALGGALKITALVTAIRVTCTIVRELPQLYTTKNIKVGNICIESSAWEANAYPKFCCFFANRLVFAGSPNFPQTVWGSKVGDFDDFVQGSRADAPFSYTISSDQAHPLRWVAPIRDLFLGSIGGEWRMSGGGGEPLSPTTVMLQQESANGSAPLPPVIIGRAVIYLDRFTQTLFEIRYAYEEDSYRSTDLTLMAPHICKPGVVDLAYAPKPYGVVWVPRSDGVLCSLTHMREHEVAGWARHITDGEVERACAIPGSLGSEVWLVVKRTIGGVVKRYHEIMQDSDYGDDLTDAWFVDSGLAYDGAPATVISGLSHLEGKTVAVWADGLVQTVKVVTGGQITLDTAASKVIVGLPYTAKLQTMRLNVPNSNQQGYTKRVHEVVMRLYKALGGKIGPDADHLEEINPRETAVYTGDKIVKYRGGWETDAKVYVEHGLPGPFTVLAAMPRFGVGEK